MGKMRIMLIGFGKMGQAIKKIAEERGNTVPVIIDQNNIEELKNITSEHVDAAIEFTQPESAFNNIKTCIENGIPVVSGTTGWLENRNEIDALVKEKNGAFFYASNFSVGVNIFFKLNKLLASMMNTQAEYNISMEEIHHIHKKDAPSGTAITLAEGVLENNTSKAQWTLDKGAEKDLVITAVREDEVPGTHTVSYESEIDLIEIKHLAHSRKGFATGAVIAAEWIKDKKGSLGMDDMLKL